MATKIMYLHSASPRLQVNSRPSDAPSYQNWRKSLLTRLTKQQHPDCMVYSIQIDHVASFAGI